MWKLLYASCFLISTLVASTPREVAEKLLPSLVLVETFDRNNLPLSIGSGFFINESEVITNFHVASGASRVVIKSVQIQVAGEVDAVSAFDKSSDLAILRVKDFKGMPLALSAASLAVGDTVYVAGNPRGLEGTFTSGLVSAFRKNSDTELIQISAPISPGSSGGPVANETGEVVAIVVATFIDGQNLNLAIPISSLKRLHRTGSQKSVSEVFGTVAEPALEHETISKSQDGALSAFAFEYSRQDVSFTIKNNSTDPVWDMELLLIAYDVQNRPIDTVRSNAGAVTVPPYLAKRHRVHFSDALPLGLVNHFEVRFLKYDVRKPSDDFIKYTMVAGDSLRKIARNYGVSIEVLQRLNPGFDWQRAKIGEQVKIPSHESK